MWTLPRWIVLSLTVLIVNPSALLALSPDISRVVEIDVPAPSLAGNLLGTATTQGAAVYLPPGYDDTPDHRYPTIYLLHGIFDDYEVWTAHFDVPGMLDRLIASGDLPPLIMVMPNGGNQYGGGFYRNSSVSGNWADFIADDLIGQVDAAFRTLPTADARAIVGHSMGGYGALNLAMTRPGVFSVVWALSPCCLAATDDFGFGNGAWKRAAAVEGPEDIAALRDARDFFAVAALGVVTAFAPDPENAPVYGDFPFEVVRGEVVLDPAEYDRYRDALPTRMVRDARDALRALRGLALDAGLGDQFIHIPPATLGFSQALGAERIPHRLDVYDGDHRQAVATRLENVVLPWVGDLLATGAQSE